jgi:hypothetical protein
VRNRAQRANRKEIAVNKLKLSGAVLATAVGLMFMTQPIFAADSSDANGAQAQASVKCVGGNSCKGQSECASASNSCKGQNSCKGKGYVNTVSTQDCQQKGGHVEKN